MLKEQANTLKTSYRRSAGEGHLVPQGSQAGRSRVGRHYRHEIFRGRGLAPTSGHDPPISISRRLCIMLYLDRVSTQGAEQRASDNLFDEKVDEGRNVEVLDLALVLDKLEDPGSGELVISVTFGGSDGRADTYLASRSLPNHPLMCLSNLERRRGLPSSRRLAYGMTKVSIADSAMHYTYRPRTACDRLGIP